MCVQSQALYQCVKGLLKSTASQISGWGLLWSTIIWKGSVNLKIGPQRVATQHLAKPGWSKAYRWSVVLGMTFRHFQNLITPGLVVKKEIALCIRRYGPLCTVRNQQAPTVCFSSLHNGSAVTVSQRLHQSWDCTCLAWAQGSAVRGCFPPHLAPLPFCTAALPQGARADTSPGAT